MPTSPIDVLSSHERALEDALLARMRGIRRMGGEIGSDLFEAVRTGRYGGITQGEAWGAGLDRAVRSASTAERALLRSGWLQGVAEIPGGKELRAEADAFAERWAAQRTQSFLAGFEVGTRENVGRMVRNAGRRYERSPSLLRARQMAEWVKTRLGLTKAQARQLEAYEREARKAKLPDSVVEREAVRRAQIAIAARARSAAEREAVEAVNFARAAAWAEARRRGIVGKLEKHWHDVGDNRVRATHAEQTREGWIPWGQAYRVFGVQHPPAPEFGCRCYERIREVRAA